MKILVLGGTGAMGVPLVQMLSRRDASNQILVTTRSSKPSQGNVVYLQGNAKDDAFLNRILEKEYDVIVDFMVYSTPEFQRRVDLLLSKTKQYFFFSSARCYANSTLPITEDNLRLVDCCDDPLYCSMDEYGMAKGRQENLLRQSGKTNWTIIRPYITYNTYRLQLGVYEKEDWLRRALAGKTIVFPKDIAQRRTSLTFGPDVAGALVTLIGNERAYGQAFHITTEENHTWGEILEFYCAQLEKATGKRPKVQYVPDSEDLQRVWNRWQIRYDRLYDRYFDNTKIESVRGSYSYTPTFEGLASCLNEFLKAPKWLGMNAKYEAYCDRIAAERTPLRQIPGTEGKLKYLKWRYLVR